MTLGLHLLKFNTSPNWRQQAIHAADKGMIFLAGRFSEIRAFRKTPLWMASRLSSPILFVFSYNEGFLPNTDIGYGVAGFGMKMWEDRSMLSLTRGRHLVVLEGSISDYRNF